MSEKFFIPKDVLNRKTKNKRQELPKNIFAGDEISIPSKITIFYNNTVDIVQIDEIIKYRYKKLKERKGYIEDKINNLTVELEGKIVMSEINDIEKKIKDEKEKLEDYTNDITINSYIKDSRYLCEEIKNTTNIDLIKEYLNIARNYIHIDIIKDTSISFNCKGCKMDLEDYIENEEGFYICPECNCINSCLKPNKYSRDFDLSNSNYDEDITNFIKVLDKFEGKNNIDVHVELYEELDEFFTRKDIPIGKKFRDFPMLENGKKKGSTKKMIWNALEHLGYNQYYDEVSYICHIYWGWKLPDLTLYRDRILRDYQNTQKIWNRIKKDYKRSASLGTQYRLYVQLLAIDYPNCIREDFRIQEMVESLRLHNHAWQRMCTEANVKYYSVST